MDLYDIAVVGAGPAGLAAALNGAVRNKKVLVLGPDASEKLQRTQEIQNYLGLPKQSGMELLAKFRQHAEGYENITFLNKVVQNVYDMVDYIGLLVESGEILKAKSVVLATGVSFGRPLEGEAELLGRGVSYCASCDAALYKNRPVVLVGYNDHAEEEANFIAELASSVTFVNPSGRDYALDPSITVLQAKPKAVEAVEQGLVLHLSDGSDLAADGVFLIRDAKAVDKLVPGIQSQGGHVLVNSKMETNLPGIYACGDLVGMPYQINVAVGRGQIAGLEAARFAGKRKPSQRAN